MHYLKEYAAMMITIDDIRAIRQIAGNVNEERVNIYIREAELLDIEPVIGADLYEKLTNIGEIVLPDGETEILDETGDNSIIVADENELPLNEYKLLNGGYYEDGSGVKHRFEGIKKALAYFAYARFVRNHGTQVTPFGVVNKLGDESQNADARSIAAVSADARKIGENWLNESMKFWRIVEDCRCSRSITGARQHRRRFVPIGD